jgi:RND family efflux transporter MFP subunit
VKRFLSTRGRTLALTVTVVVILGLFGYVAVRSGPLAPVQVTVATVEIRSISPVLFGIGTVEARATHKIGPTVAGRLLRIEVDAGDTVTAGQTIGEMDSIDLDERIRAMEAAIARAEAGARSAEAQIIEVAARRSFARTQLERYTAAEAEGVVSRETLDAKRQEAEVAEASHSATHAGLASSRQDASRQRAERDGLLRQRENLRLVAPVDGVVSRRLVDPGSTAVAGQAVVEIIEPGRIWVHARFDQQRAAGLRPGLSARIVLHSRDAELIAGRVVRVEPHADPVTEELLAKVEFDRLEGATPSIGELAEVTVALEALAPRPTIPSTAIQRLDGRIGVWLRDDGSLRFTPVRTGAADLEGNIQILDGLDGREEIVVYSRQALTTNSRIQVVDHIPGVERSASPAK